MKKEDEDDKEALKKEKEEEEKENTRPDDWEPGNWGWSDDIPTSSGTVGAASRRFTKDEAVDDDDDDGKMKTDKVMDNKEDEEDETRTMDDMQEHGKLRGMEQKENDEETRKKEDKEDEKRKEEKRNAVVFRKIHNTSTNRNTISNQKAEEEEENHKDAVYNNRNDGWTTGNWSWLPATRSHPANEVAIEPTRTRRNRTADRFLPKQGNDDGGGKMKSEDALNEEDDDHDNDNGSFPPLSSSVSGIPRRTKSNSNCNRTHNDDRNDVWAAGNWSWLPVPRSHLVNVVLARRTVAVETIPRTRKTRSSDRFGMSHPPRKKMRRSTQKTNEDLDYRSDTDTDTATTTPNDFCDTNIEDNHHSNDEGDSEGNDGSSNIYKVRWAEMYDRLVAYKKKYKSTCVPESDGCLGRWINGQRTRHRNKQLSQYRINRLETIGFVWSVSNDVRWTELYDRLVAYKKKYKTTCVPRSYPSDLQLGPWVSQQRVHYSTKNASLTADRISRLNSIKFEWHPLNVLLKAIIITALYFSSL